jgi:hypothetical protein
MALNPYAESFLNNAPGKAGKDRQPWGLTMVKRQNLNSKNRRHSQFSFATIHDEPCLLQSVSR